MSTHHSRGGDDGGRVRHDDPMEMSKGLTGADVRALTFRKAGFGHRSYVMDEVDAFLERVAAALDGVGEQLCAADVAGVRFAVGRGRHKGYDESQVDAALDRIEAAVRRRFG